VATYNAPSNFTFINVAPTPGAPYGGAGVNFGAAGGPPLPSNTSVYAIDSNTGKAIWHFNIPTVGFRGGIAVSGGIVFIPAVDGNLYMVDEHTGTLVSKLLVGEMNNEPAIAQDSNGNYKIIVPSSAAGTVGGTTIPGNVFALSVPKQTSPHSLTTNVTTVASTAGAISVVTVTTQVTTQIINQVTTSTGSGISSTAFYGVAVVAVILLITTVLFAMRRRPAAPASSTTTTTKTM
jgi:PQQ-like domain